MWKNKRVGVLMGGFSAERDVSLRTGAGVVRALQERGYDAFPVVLGSPRVILQNMREPTRRSDGSL